MGRVRVRDAAPGHIKSRTTDLKTGLCGMEHLRILLLPHGGDALCSSIAGLPSTVYRRYRVYTRVKRETIRKQNNTDTIFY